MNRDIDTVYSAENVYAHLKSELLNQGIAALLPAHVTRSSLPVPPRQPW